MSIEPAFLEESLFDRHSNWTQFEKELFNLFTMSNCSKGLLFSKRLKVVDAMREAGIKALAEIDQ